MPKSKKYFHSYLPKVRGLHWECSDFFAVSESKYDIIAFIIRNQLNLWYKQLNISPTIKLFTEKMETILLGKKHIEIQQPQTDVILF